MEESNRLWEWKGIALRSRLYCRMWVRRMLLVGKWFKTSAKVVGNFAVKAAAFLESSPSELERLFKCSSPFFRATRPTADDPSRTSSKSNSWLCRAPKKAPSIVTHLSTNERNLLRCRLSFIKKWKVSQYCGLCLKVPFKSIFLRRIKLILKITRYQVSLNQVKDVTFKDVKRWRWLGWIFKVSA